MIQGRELALAVLSLRGRPAESIVTAAALAGFDSLTLRLVEPKEGDHGHLVQDASARRSLKRLMDAHGVGLLDVEVVRLRPDADLAALLPALDAASDLGARHVLAVCEDPDDERFLAALIELAHACSDRDLGCVLEFMRFSECRSFEQAVRVVQRARLAGAQGLGVLVDPLHLQRSGGTPEQVGLYAADFPELFPYVQMCDGPLQPPRGGVAQVRDEAVTSRLLPGDGELPLQRLLAALPQGIPVSMETPVRSLESLSDMARAAAAFAAGRKLLLDDAPMAH